MSSRASPEFGGQGRRKGGDVLGRGRLRGADEERSGERRVVRNGPGERQAGQNTAAEKAAMDLGGAQNSDGELVEIRPGMQTRGSGGGEGHLQLRGTGGAERGNVTQAVRPNRREIDGGRQSTQRLIGAD